MAVVIGLDVGGTKIAGGLVGASGELIVVRERATLVDGRGDPGLGVTAALARQLLTDARQAGLEVEGIGAGFPEYVGQDGQLRSHEVLAWTRQPSELLAKLGPVTIESDVRCAALGEAARGAAQDLDDFAFIIVGTGLSYTLVEGGEARPGVHGEAIALGELEVSRRLGETAALSLERFASGQGIRERFEARSGRRVSGAADVVRLAAEGDALAEVVVRSAAQALGEGLATLVRLLDPGALVVGGGLSAATGVWREVLEATLLERLRSRADVPRLRWAKLGRDAGIIGAAIAHRRRTAARSA